MMVVVVVTAVVVVMVLVVVVRTHPSSFIIQFDQGPHLTIYTQYLEPFLKTIFVQH